MLFLQSQPSSLYPAEEEGEPFLWSAVTIFFERLSPFLLMLIKILFSIRTIYLKDGREHEVDGIKGLRYAGGTDLIDSGIVDPETSCFLEGEPTPLGLLNITKCRHGAPVFISYPHFYLGDPALVKQVNGMQPDQEKHEFSLTVEPVSLFQLVLEGFHSQSH